MEHDVDETGTLLDILNRLLPASSNRTLRRMLTSGRVLVDATVEHRANRPIELGARITILDRSKAMDPKGNRTRDAFRDLIWEDEHLILVNKPSGLLSVATDRLEQDTMHARTVDHIRISSPRGWAHIVHRLDRGTSGVLILARHERHQRNLQRQFEDRTVHRRYLALVEGRPTDESGTVVQHLIEDRNLRVHAVARGTQGARDAITHWTFISERTGASLIDITIETGRRHQIRKAMSSIGTPVIGDRDHGGHRSDLHRLGLHAWSIEFDHPETGEPMEGVAPIPNPFRPWVDASKIPFANF